LINRKSLDNTIYIYIDIRVSVRHVVVLVLILYVINIKHSFI